MFGALQRRIRTWRAHSRRRTSRVPSGWGHVEGISGEASWVALSILRQSDSWSDAGMLTQQAAAVLSRPKLLESLAGKTVCRAADCGGRVPSMDMYDEIQCAAPSPDGYKDTGTRLQTKSFPDPGLHRYKITSGGRLTDARGNDLDVNKRRQWTRYSSKPASKLDQPHFCERIGNSAF